MSTLKSILAMLSVCLLFASAGAYTTQMYIPAVLTNLNKGNLTLVMLNVTKGSGSVHLIGPENISSDTVTSAQTAAMYAASLQGVNFSKYNFTYTIEDFNTSVSGPSGGLAFTLLAVAGLQQRQLSSGFTATGTISSSGDVGLIGGAYEKTGAAKSGGLNFVIVPAAAGDSSEALIYYLAQHIYGIPLVEVANVSQALPYAFGLMGASFTPLNLTENYSIASLGGENITCSSCDDSNFSVLVNYTYNFSRSYVLNISSNFSEAKQELLNNLDAYRTLYGKGYLYTSADLTFLDFIQAFTLANSQNLSASGTSQVLSNVSSYCSSLMPPPMTDRNYEFVIGGRIRQIWGNITITNAENTLSAEQTSDDMVQSLDYAAQALGWCKAAYESYSIASTIGGNYVETSPSLKTEAATEINDAMGSSGMYLQAATQAYSSGDYATALYSAVYAKVFGPSNSTNLSQRQLYSRTLQNIYNATAGTWPSQFAIQSEFYLRQSMMSQGAQSTGYAQQAYSVSELADGLEYADSAISGSFIVSSVTSQGVPQQLVNEINGIQQNISQIYAILLFNAVVMLAILVVLLFHLLSRRSKAELAKPRGRGARRRR